ncbi:MAG: Lrp/AsnC family transcriptional regulator [Candidatus Altiarchaeota archaeon]|nr:Lrp/AsnC family transcriptional regulator [Candidatus Altiarchaeota archaeon]
MDKKDGELLEVLEKNARLTSKELATMLGLPEPEIDDRIKRLKQSGVLKKFTTVIDWEKAGKESVTAYIDVKVVPEARTGFTELGELIAAHENVEEVCVASGEYDLLVKIRCKDLKEVSEFVTEVLAPKKSVTGTMTHFVLKKFKEKGVVLGESKKDKHLVISP